MEGDSSIVGSTDHRVSESPVTAKEPVSQLPAQQRLSEPRADSWAPRAHSPPKFAAAIGAARRRERKGPDWRHSSAGLSLGASRQPSPQFSRREEKGGGGAYGDDVAVAPGEDVAAAEDGAHRVDELADVPVHPASLSLSFS